MNKQIFLFLFLFLGVHTVYADATQYNLLKNPGFESGKNGWDSYGSAVRISSDSHSGQKALLYQSGGTGQTTGLLPNIEAIDGKTTYTLSGYYKNTGKVDGMWIGVIYYDSNWDTIEEKEITLAASTVYKKFTVLNAPPKGTNYIGIWTWSDADSGGKTLLDDLKLYPAQVDIETCQLVQNGGFEKNLNGWSLYSSETIHTNDAHAGAKAIQLMEGGMDQTITLFGNQPDTYEMSGYYKTVGTPSGTWVGMNFYDQNDQLIFEQSISLSASTEYKKFSVNATSTKDTSYVQVWVWTEGGSGGGKVIVDDLVLKGSGCFDFVVPSSLPPHGMKVAESPQFVVLGFDDNTMSQGIQWAINLFQNKKNSDGSDAKVSFFMNTEGLDTEIEDDPAQLLTACKTLKESGHEIGNHTYNHFSDIDSSDWDLYAKTIRELDLPTWHKYVADGETKLIDPVGVAAASIKGFRAPYLLYNKNMLNTLKSRNYLYDCSIEEGFGTQFDGSNLRWPYQLNEGSPGHVEGWYGNPENSEYVAIDPVKDLWEVPVYVLMIPKDKDCAKYGIKKGLWHRMVKELGYLGDHKITGFDYNLWNMAKLNKSEVLGILKYNLDLRLKGNRAPFTFGAHTQYYTDTWASEYAPNATATEMRAAISEFVDYALSKPEVRIRPMSDIVHWCQNPVALPK